MLRRARAYLRQQIPRPHRLPDEPSRAQFESEESNLTFRSLKLLCLLAIVLVPATAGLDAALYPDLFKQFFFLRLLCAGALIAVLASLRTAFARKHHRAYTILVPLIPAIFISCMIYLARDPNSPYYAGLTLCLVACGFIFQWSHREASWATFATLILYGIAIATSYLAGHPVALSTIPNNIVFIALNGLVIVGGSYFHHRTRVREFRTRLELDLNQVRDLRWF